MDVQISLQDSDFISFGYTLRSKVATLETLFFIFWGNSLLFPIITIPVCISTNNVQSIPLFHILTNTCHLLTFWNSYSWRDKGICHCDFDFYLMISDAEHPFIYLLTICVFLEKCLFRLFAHCLTGLFFNWVNITYQPRIEYMVGKHTPHMHTYSIDCLFVLSTFPLAM